MTTPIVKETNNEVLVTFGNWLALRDECGCGLNETLRPTPSDKWVKYKGNDTFLCNGKSVVPIRDDWERFDGYLETILK